jgi:putative membrane protein
MPTLNACLNGASALLLLLGYISIKGGKPERHKRFMLAAMISSALFLISYLIYHSQVGSVPYPYHNWTRPLYFIILIPHSILAAVMVPFIIMAAYYALRGNFAAHTRITKRLWPVWMFVSLTGIVVYLMLYIF